MTVILVTGGRDFSDKKFLYKTLDNLHKKLRISKVIQGYARGADRLADSWARSRGISSSGATYYITDVDWRKLGYAAGPLRNQRMLNSEPDIEYVVAFPGGTGTADMIERSVKAGKVILRANKKEQSKMQTQDTDFEDPESIFHLYQFLKSKERNSWLGNKVIEVYVRKGFHIIEGKMRRCLDVASVTTSPKYRGKGYFTRFIDYAESFGYVIYLENVFNEDLISFFKKRGYKSIQENDYPLSFFKDGKDFAQSEG